MKMKDKLKFLQIDTSNENFLFIKLVNNDIQQHILLKEKRCHMKELVPSINNLLQIENLKISDFDFIALNEGPGSWTGLRIGFATAKILAQISNTKIILYNNFEVIQNRYLATTGVFLVKAALDKYYYLVLNNKNILESGLISNLELQNFFPEFERYYLHETDLECDSLLVNKYLQNLFSNCFEIEPYYLGEGVIIK
jgi:tRNA threonylcarbamoyl adenosine modification protein YeaZ